MPDIIAEVPVHIHRNLSFAELIALAEFASVDDYFLTIKEEPVEASETVAVAKLVHYWQTSGTRGSQVLGEMKYDLRLCPATFGELLELAVEYPDQPKSGGIIALGTSWEQHPGYKVCASIWNKEGQRELHIDQLDGNWRNTAKFMAFDAEPSQQ